MIQASELRIGNIIKYYGRYTRVEPNNITELSKGAGDYKPIPLTEEILLKCGFEKINKHKELDSHGYLMDGMEYLHTIDNGITFTDSVQNEIEFKYLHQLQNLYFALTNKELEVNL